MVAVLVQTEGSRGLMHEAMARYATAAAHLSQPLDSRLVWNVGPRDAFTRSDEAFVLSGRTTDRNVHLLGIATQLGTINLPINGAQARTTRHLAGSGINQSGQRYRYTLTLQSQGRLSEPVDVVRLTTRQIPRHHGEKRTDLIRLRATRLHRMRVAGLHVIRTEAHPDGPHQYRIIDHLRPAQPQPHDEP